MKVTLIEHNQTKNTALFELEIKLGKTVYENERFVYSGIHSDEDLSFAADDMIKHLKIRMKHFGLRNRPDSEAEYASSRTSSFTGINGLIMRVKPIKHEKVTIALIKDSNIDESTLINNSIYFNASEIGKKPQRKTFNVAVRSNSELKSQWKIIVLAYIDFNPQFKRYKKQLMKLCPSWSSVINELNTLHIEKQGKPITFIESFECQ